MRRLLIFWSALFGALSLAAQEPEVGVWVHASDTLQYTYTPLASSEVEAVVAQTKSPKGWKKWLNYFDPTHSDQIPEKRFDVTLVGGPSYSSTYGVGLSVMADGFYRTDRNDHHTPPSYLSLLASVSTTGFYTVGLRGKNSFRHDKNRLNYQLQFWSKPLNFWGVGYHSGMNNASTEYDEKLFQIEVNYLHRLTRNLYGGLQASFQSVRGKNFENPAYWEGMADRYYYMGFGLLAEYDSRDFAPNARRGIHLFLSGLFYPQALSNCNAPLWQAELTLSGYQTLWKSGVLAAELCGELNSPKTPWPFMARMGGNERMRGYYEGRYVDCNLITLQVELRQRIWSHLGGVIWGGAGTVFPSFTAFRWSEILPNYGLGLRWEFGNRVNIRIDYGFGKHTQGLVLQLNEAF